MNIVLKLPTTPAAPPVTDLEGEPATPTYSPDSRITLNLTNVPLYEALRYVATLAGLKVKSGTVRRVDRPPLGTHRHLGTARIQGSARFYRQRPFRRSRTASCGRTSVGFWRGQAFGSAENAKDFL